MGIYVLFVVVLSVLIVELFVEEEGMFFLDLVIVVVYFVDVLVVFVLQGYDVGCV